MKEGYNNAWFFHRLAKFHRNANFIKRIEVDGVIYEDESDVRSQLVLFYQGLFEEIGLGRPTMDGLDFACIVEEERLTLGKEFTKEEVIQVLRRWRVIKPLGLMGSPWLSFTIARALWKRMSWISLFIFIGTLCLNDL